MRASLFTAVVSDATDVVKVPKLVFVVSSDACGAFAFTVAVRVLKSVVSTFKAKALFISVMFAFVVSVVFVLSTPKGQLLMRVMYLHRFGLPSV